MSGLLILHLKCCGLDDDAITLIARALHYAPKLVNLELDGNLFTDVGLRELVYALESTPNIEWIMLAGMHFTDKSLLPFAKRLSALQHIVVVYIDGLNNSRFKDILFILDSKHHFG